MMFIGTVGKRALTKARFPVGRVGIEYDLPLENRKLIRKNDIAWKAF